MQNGEGQEKHPAGQAAEDLFNYAVDRDDVKYLMDNLSPEADIDRVTVEYELQALKIVSVGWSISYFLENMPERSRILSIFWQAVRDYAGNLSYTTGLMTGQQIDYFQMLKDRLDMYVTALMENPDAPEPAVVIGPVFAEKCGNSADIFTTMAGSKMFLSTLTNVRRYLEKALPE
jgi:hypothetical protein